MAKDLNHLGRLLIRSDRARLAEPFLRESIPLIKKRYGPHSLELSQGTTVLGRCFARQGKLGDAIAIYREAIEIDPKHPDAHCDLGHALRLLGRFKEALAELRKGHELGSKESDWNLPSARWVAECEALVPLESRIPALLSGEVASKDNAECLALGRWCYESKRFAVAARFWGDALTNDPKLGDDRQAGHRYNAACAAALAVSVGPVATGRPVEPALREPPLDDTAKVKLRSRALGWLKAELSAWKKVAMTVGPGNKELVDKTLAHWKEDADLAGVRELTELAKIPEAERTDWQALWAEVDSLLQKVGKP